MHAISLSHAWHRWHDHAPRAAAPRAAPARPAAAEQAAASVVVEPAEPLPAMIRWLPLAVPGMALLLLVCATVIGTGLR